MGRKGSSGMGGGTINAESIASFNPTTKELTNFKLNTMDGEVTVRGYVDGNNQLGYTAFGPNVWNVYDMVTGNSYTSGGNFKTAVNSASKLVDTLKKMRNK